MNATVQKTLIYTGVHQNSGTVSFVPILDHKIEIADAAFRSKKIAFWAHWIRLHLLLTPFLKRVELDLKGA